MAKELFKNAESKQLNKIKANSEKGIKDVKLGNFAVNHIVEINVEKAKSTVARITEEAINRMAELDKECKKAEEMKPDSVTYSSEGGVRIPAFTEKTWEAKKKPFDTKAKIVEAFDKAVESGDVKDFEALEKLLKK